MIKCDACASYQPNRMMKCAKQAKSFAKEGKGCRGFAYPVTLVQSCNIKELLEVQDWWTQQADAYGDIGSCVIGAKFTFTRDGRPFVMYPRSRWQGSCSWEASWWEVKTKLEAIGCTNVDFHYGVLD